MLTFSRPCCSYVESVDFIESSEPFPPAEPLRGRLGTQESVGPLRGRVSMVDPGLIRQHIEDGTLLGYPKMRSTFFSNVATEVESVDFIESSEPFPPAEPLRGRLGTQESVGPLRGRVSMVDPGLIRQHIEGVVHGASRGFTSFSQTAAALTSVAVARGEEHYEFPASGCPVAADLRTRARDAVQSGVFNAMILIVVNAVLLGVEIQVSSHIGEDDIPSWFMVVNTGIVGLCKVKAFDVVIVAFSALEVVIDLFAQTLAASMWGADAWSFMRTLRLARAA
ncbi:hypothetical protein AK812_SmicGene36532 [Symbiodinium microadriaticum]|uniref:Uncharacterized protein n=1 Tax=Symbiodinium microadriaticum TaxID=2951 RepID=A0A1Q9CIT5_SYMMI|nr:hypothetical protein AK812_SmicGene36532 [Symbiodinium microadriaticum]